MPSAANVKIEKQQQQSQQPQQIVTETAVAVAAAAAATTTTAVSLNDAAGNSPIRQAITVIEHKIRNLEKRKSKLESYRDLQRSGKDLNQDQKTAVAKYDEVVQTLEFARDLCKQFLGIALVSEKEEKKKARKEGVARSQTELTKIREVLLVQDALTNMGQDAIREDFLQGRNGAATLTQTDLKLMDDLYIVVNPKHEAGDPTAFMPQVQAAAEHLLAVVDGKPKEAFGATYSQIKEVIGKIHESGYLDQATETYEEVPPVEGGDMVPSPVVPVENVPVCENIPVERPMVMEPQIVPQQMTIEVAAPVPTVVQAVVPMQQAPAVPETIFFAQQAPQPRPITEVLGGGSFFFLQDSELDTPPEQIPSQTFTNQTFVATGPPPPIPMPPHFQQFPNAPQQQQQQQQQVPVIQQSPPQVMQPPPTQNNGIGDHQDVVEDPVRQQPPPHRVNGPQGPQNNRQHPPPQRSNNTTHHQPYFANNNGYPRPNRNRNNNPGPRPNNRHNNAQ